MKENLLKESNRIIKSVLNDWILCVGVIEEEIEKKIEECTHSGMSESREIRAKLRLKNS